MTLYHRGKASAVEEEYHLFASLQRLPYGCEEHRREGTCHHLTSLQVLGVDDLYLGQFYSLVSLHHLHIAILARLGVVPALCRRSSRSEQGLCLVHGGKYYGSITGIIARGRVLLLE